MTFLIAQEAGATAVAEGAVRAGGLQGFLESMGMMPVMILVFAIFYFMLIRPQQRKDKERRKQIEALIAGKRIIFAGGIIGVIKETKEATFKVEIANGVVVEIARGAVNRVLEEGEAVSADEKN